MYTSDLFVVTTDIPTLVPLWHEGLYPGMLVFIVTVLVSEGHGWNVETVNEMLFRMLGSVAEKHIYSEDIRRPVTV
jgi:hypothetical protein